ncbi:MAG: amidohydrolase family protein [Methylococcales bacterium]
MHEQGWSTVRIAYNLFAQTAGKEYQDFANWVDMIAPGTGDSFLQMNGAGENIVWTACDFENFQEPQPELGSNMEMELETVMRLLLEERWPFRLHATYDESINHFLNVFERVNQDIPFDGLRWFFDHAETVSHRNIERTGKLGGGFAIQDRMAFQGEYFIQRYGQAAADATPPIRNMLAMGVPVGTGTDATRVSSFNPWVSLYWLVSGKTVGGTALSDEKNCLTREQALRLYTSGSAWFSGEQQQKGTLSLGQFADLTVLSEDFMTIEVETIKQLVSVMTVVGGNIVYANQDFKLYDPPLPPVSPDWSPVGRYAGYYQEDSQLVADLTQNISCAMHGRHFYSHAHEDKNRLASALQDPFWGSLGCTCFAF